MQPTSRAFKKNATAALADAQLQRALANAGPGFITKRAAAREALPEFDALCAQARDIKNHALAHLDLYLEAYEEKVIESGGHVHWAATAEEARSVVVNICREADAKLVTKGKSMIAEEIALNSALEAAGLEAAETDLGEYIIQIRNEPPSHIIAPAFHLNRDQVEADFRRVHKDLAPSRNLDEPVKLVSEARAVLRRKFIAADVGITGANFLVAETGSSVSQRMVSRRKPETMAASLSASQRSVSSKTTMGCRPSRPMRSKAWPSRAVFSASEMGRSVSV